VDAQVGYAVGGYTGTNKILKTTNGGASWVSQNSGTTHWLRSVDFPVDAQTGYAVGDTGTILKTTDGGTNWVSQNSGTTRNFFSVHFPVDIQTGYVAGGMNSNILVKTTDCGANWFRLSPETDVELFSVYFPVDASTGYITGGNGAILKTTDGGTWVEEERAEGRGQRLEVRIKIRPNPFVSFATIPGQEGKRFEMYDVPGRRVGVYQGDRVGLDLGAGVYFVRPECGMRNAECGMTRVVKVR
jgi:photosystem II stability/assembly factor-like uncharacterized protein